MKKLGFLLLLSCGFTVFSQSKITQGVLTSKQTLSSDNTQVNAQFSSIGDIITTTYFKDNRSKSESSNPMTGKTVVVIDNDSKEMLITMDNQMIGKNYLVKSTIPTEEDLKNITLTKGDETKTILGYACQEYNLTVVKDGSIVTMDMFVTDALNVVSQQTTMLGEEFKGLPLLMTIKMNNMGMDMTITHEVTEIKAENVSSDIFVLTPPEGYTKTDKLMGI